jgi:hypothetical protein
MTLRELRVPSAVDPDTIDQIVEAAIDMNGLCIVARVTLATYPSSQHLHVKLEKQPGTLEVTWWPPKNRLWMSVHANRSGAWTTAAMQQIGDAIEEQLQMAAFPRR